jgi:carbonic anhydrase/acetyltransferase-like protein (isoleucine patch superfamily)/enamine deaminase RidA (YjgF/YER057c/UK114 family)
MLIEHEGRRPKVNPSAYVAPTAVLSGDVRVGPGCQVLFGAVLTDDGGPVELGESTIVMENAVLRGTRRDPVRIGAHCLVGPGSYLVGASVDDDCFLATGVTVFNGARLGRGCEVRINATVHLRTVLPPGALVPIGWVAVGDPALIAPPERHQDIWAVQRELDFPGYVWGLPRPDPAAQGVAGGQMTDITRRFGRLLARHAHDRPIGEHGTTQADRQLVSSESPWEPLVGYSRAIRVGQWVSVAGTTAAAEGGGAVGGTDIGAQAREALRRIEVALRQADAALEHVVRTRMYVTDISRWEQVGRVHGEVFGSIRPATSMIEVSRLIEPALLVEIEADAVVP